jgi:hypothetical protein
MNKLVAFSLVICMCFVVWVVSRLNMIEVGIPYAQPASPSASLTATWLGVTTVLFDYGETQIMTDGFMPGHLDDLQDEAIFSGVGGIGQLDSEHIFDYVCATVQAVEARRVYITHHDNFHAPFGQMEQSG